MRPSNFLTPSPANSQAGSSAGSQAPSSPGYSPIVGGLPLLPLNLNERVANLAAPGLRAPNLPDLPVQNRPAINLQMRRENPLGNPQAARQLRSLNQLFHVRDRADQAPPAANNSPRAEAAAPQNQPPAESPRTPEPGTPESRTS